MLVETQMLLILLLGPLVRDTSLNAKCFWLHKCREKNWKFGKKSFTRPFLKRLSFC